jgi:hypothetical protein
MENYLSLIVAFVLGFILTQFANQVVLALAH